MDPVHGTMDLFHGIFSRKIMQKLKKIRGPGNFVKTPLNFFKIMF
jgi:hypothetical protein